MHYNIYDVFYSQYFQQHVSASIPAIFRVVLLVQEYKHTNLDKLSTQRTTVSTFSTFHQPTMH